MCLKTKSRFENGWLFTLMYVKWRRFHAFIWLLSLFFQHRRGWTTIWTQHGHPRTFYIHWHPLAPKRPVHCNSHSFVCPCARAWSRCRPVVIHVPPPVTMCHQRTMVASPAHALPELCMEPSELSLCCFREGAYVGSYQGPGRGYRNSHTSYIVHAHAMFLGQRTT